MNPDLDISEYMVDLQSWTEDMFWGVFSLLQLHVIDEAIRNQDPGIERPGSRVRRLKTLPCRILVFVG